MTTSSMLPSACERTVLVEICCRLNLIAANCRYQLCRGYGDVEIRLGTECLDGDSYVNWGGCIVLATLSSKKRARQRRPKSFGSAACLSKSAWFDPHGILATVGFLVRRHKLTPCLALVLAIIALSYFSGCSFSFPNKSATKTETVIVPLTEYEFHRTLGMTPSQLETELRKVEGYWSIWDDYADGWGMGPRVIGTWHPQFMLRDGRVYAIQDQTITGHPTVAFDGKITRPWIDRHGRYHSELIAPDKSSVRPLVSFRVTATDAAISKVKDQWHRKHPGIRVCIRCPQSLQDVQEYKITTSSGNRAIDEEALDLASEYLPTANLPKRPEDNDHIGPRVIELD